MRRLTLAVLLLAGCSRPPQEPPPQYKIEDGRVVFQPESPMLKRLEVLEVGAASQESRAFRTVGQMIALSNRSESLVGDGIGWVELDPAITRSLGLRLDGSVPAGTAYGLTNLPSDYADRVKVGHQVDVQRYGLRRTSVSATIVKVEPVLGDGVNVVFRFGNAQDWFPGTNTEVSFPLISGHPVRIPTTAPVHAGTQEYVWKVLAPGLFEARLVSIVDSTPDDAAVLGLQPGDKIVGRGAILLRPLLDTLLTGRNGQQ